MTESKHEFIRGLQYTAAKFKTCVAAPSNTRFLQCTASVTSWITAGFRACRLVKCIYRGYFTLVSFRVISSGLDTWCSGFCSLTEIRNVNHTYRVDDAVNLVRHPRCKASTEAERNTTTRNRNCDNTVRKRLCEVSPVRQATHTTGVTVRLHHENTPRVVPDNMTFLVSAEVKWKLGCACVRHKDIWGWKQSLTHS